MADLNGLEIAKSFLKDVTKQYGIDLTTALTGLLNGFTTEHSGKQISVPAIINKNSVDLLTEAYKQLTNKTLF